MTHKYCYRQTSQPLSIRHFQEASSKVIITASVREQGSGYSVRFLRVNYTAVPLYARGRPCISIRLLPLHRCHSAELLLFSTTPRFRTSPGHSVNLIGISDMAPGTGTYQHIRGRGVIHRDMSLTQKQAESKTSFIYAASSSANSGFGITQ